MKVSYFCAENNENKHIFFRGTPQKLAATRAAFLIQICTKSCVSWGFETPLDPQTLAVILGLTSRGQEGKGRVGQRREKEGGEGK